MINANIKKIIPALVTVVFILICSCSSPEDKRANSLAEVAQLQAAGNIVAALELLEKLSQQFPDDSEIIKQIGLSHQKLGNHAEAAFYLDVAHTLSPNDSELLFQAYLANEDADQPDAAYELLEAFARAKPEDMTGKLWFRLGELHVQAQKSEAALKAYLEGVKLTNEKPSTEVALIIGTLFKKLDNLPMAERWLAIAAKGDDSNALPALFGILEINLRSKKWEASEKTIALLDKKFPGAVDASQWANVRQELTKWRSAKANMDNQLKKLEQPNQAAQPNESANIQATSSTNIQPAASGKARVVADVANAEALANNPAKETGSKEITVASIEQKKSAEPTAKTESEIVFNPNIIIQPAEPDVELDDDEPIEPDIYLYNETIGPQNSVVSNASEVTTSDYLVDENSEQESVLVSELPETSLPDTALLSVEELIAKAKDANSKGDYRAAIQFYWDVLEREKDKASIWNELAKVYFSAKQTKNAATIALEATRLSPENIEYLLDYLRLVQHVKKPADFIKELEIAYDRFPRNPEITLSLARGYHRIGENNYAARILYKRFIQMAPKHPLRSEAEAELARIR